MDHDFNILLGVQLALLLKDLVAILKEKYTSKSCSSTIKKYLFRSVFVYKYKVIKAWLLSTVFISMSTDAVQ